MPGRHEKPLPPDGTAINDLARRLRQLRGDAGLTYDELAKKSNYSKTALQALCSGRPPLSPTVAAAFIAACGQDIGAWQPYIDAAMAIGPQVGVGAPTGVPADTLASPAAVPELSVQPSPMPGGSTPESTGAGQTPTRHRRRRIGIAAAVITVLVVAAAIVIVVTTGRHHSVASPSSSTTTPTSPSMPSTSPAAVTTAPTVTTTAAALKAQPSQSGSSSPVVVSGPSPSVPVSGAALSMTSAPRSMTLSGPPHVEEAFARNGSLTFGTVEGGGPNGPVVQFGEKVPVLCKVLAPTMKSVSPDGYWYRLGGQWGGRFYAPANTFLNGDSPNAKVFTHNTDMAVPDC